MVEQCTSLEKCFSVYQCSFMFVNSYLFSCQCLLSSGLFATYLEMFQHKWQVWCNDSSTSNNSNIREEYCVIYAVMDSLASQFLRYAVEGWWKAAIVTEVSKWHSSISPFSSTSCPALGVVHGWGWSHPSGFCFSRPPHRDRCPLSNSHSLFLFIVECMFLNLWHFNIV